MPKDDQNSPSGYPNTKQFVEKVAQILEGSKEKAEQADRFLASMRELFDLGRQAFADSEAAPKSVSPNPTRWAIGAQEWPGISKLNEECGEVVQVVGKLLGNDGAAKHWDGTNLHERLTEEISDAWAAILFVIEANPDKISKSVVDRRVTEKLALFRKWHKS